MKRSILLLALLSTACSTRAPAPPPPESCSPCRIEIRNTSDRALDLRLDDLDHGPVIGSVGPQQIKEFTLDAWPRRIFGTYTREQRYVRGCRYTGDTAGVHRFECR
jgi:hypothetical protein